jgi:hypothetical protein
MTRLVLHGYVHGAEKLRALLTREGGGVIER